MSKVKAEPAASAYPIDSRGRTKVSLEGGGRLFLERSVPFLCLCREEQDVSAFPLIKAEAAYLNTRGAEPKLIRRMVRQVAGQIEERWGALLLLEVWIGGPSGQTPVLRIHTDRRAPTESVVELLQARLQRIALKGLAARVEVERVKRVGTSNTEALFEGPIRGRRIFHLGLEVSPCFVYRGRVAPARLRLLRRKLSAALRFLFFEFANEHTHRTVKNAQTLGPQRLLRVVRDADEALADVGAELSLILQATPTNLPGLWRQWTQSETVGPFRYRPLTTNVYELKRRLHNIPIENIHDPALYYLMRDKQVELDRKLTMLLDLGTPRFLQGSLQVYGAVNPEVLKQAKRLLKVIPPRLRGPGQRPAVSAKEMRSRALREIKRYRDQFPDFRAEVKIRPDLAAGLVCSKGDLLISEKNSVPANRVRALLQHEVGTHLLTYYNGLSQPLKLLGRGLPGNVTLQEGIAVFSEYLSGGLHPARLRILAARVIAVHLMLSGLSLGDTIKKLRDTYGMTNKQSFDVSCRVFRGGGLTKDALYLEGLMQVLEFVKAGNEIEVLFLGKFALKHLPILEELLQRKILNAAPCRPIGLGSKAFSARLKRAAAVSCVADLLEE